MCHSMYIHLRNRQDFDAKAIQGTRDRGFNWHPFRLQAQSTTRILFQLSWLRREKSWILQPTQSPGLLRSRSRPRLRYTFWITGIMAASLCLPGMIMSSKPATYAGIMLLLRLSLLARNMALDPLLLLRARSRIFSQIFGSVCLLVSQRGFLIFRAFRRSISVSAMSSSAWPRATALVL